MEKIVTPTLIMSGEKDYNVPLLNSEQLFQAIRRVGKVPTQLVVYPGQSHTFTKPSYKLDRLHRYLGWYNQTVGGMTAGADELFGTDDDDWGM
eukprot:COSAG06_NODE_13994_length_1199_cov_1.174545_2_plen_93_part_00